MTCAVATTASRSASPPIYARIFMWRPLGMHHPVVAPLPLIGGW
jgi:hypothetical protein